jgi:ATP-dependent helicase/nuclease subunit B
VRMLKILQFSSPDGRKNLLSDFDPTHTTWIVSDLRSKFEIQQHLLKKNGHFEDHSVLRASEFWQTILRRFAPEISIVNRDFIRSWLKENLENEGHAASHRSEETVLEMMDLFSQVFSHPEGGAKIVEWLEQNSGAQERWSIWFQLAHDYGQKILRSNRILPKWIAGFLSNRIGWEKFWNRSLIIDLGGEFRRAEMDLIQTLARQVDIALIEPILQEREKYEYLLQPYQDIRGYAADVQNLTTPKAQVDDYFLRFSGKLGEVKHVVSRTRKLLESGVPAHEIAVIAPDIESYWPLLQPFFDEEGIAVAKDSTARLHSFPLVSWWLSRLRLVSKNFNYADLEISAYQVEQNLPLKFAQFQSLFCNLIDVDDLSRNLQVKSAFLDQQIPSGPMNREYFLAVAVRLWQDEAPLDELEIIVKEIISNSDRDLKLKFKNWLAWIEQLLGKLEVKTSAGHAEGVQLNSLLSSDSATFAHRFFLGLSESNFKNKRVSLISSSEIKSIFDQTGYQLLHPEQTSLQFELDWLAKSSVKENYFCYPQSTDRGGEETPHRFWLQGIAEKKIPVSIPAMTRLDSLQRQEGEALAEERQWSKEHLRLLTQQIEIDAGRALPDSFVSTQKISLSSSSFEKFHDCPFKFAAEKVFRLVDLPEADISPDLTYEGRLVHRLFELLAAEPRRYKYEQEELSALLEKIHEEMKETAYVGDTRLWPPLKNKMLKLAERFLVFEKARALPGVKTVAREHKFQFVFADREWSGAIDRIDQLGDQGIAVIDYKRKNRKFNFQHWLKENHLQLAFYSWALRKGLIKEFKDRPVLSAYYYIYRNFELLGSEDASEFETLFTEIEGKVEKLTEALRSGAFPPQPRDLEKSCQYCRWSQLCRAPHLNK